MTTTETTAHPYRSDFEPSPFDGALRIPYAGQERMRFALSSGLAHSRIVIDPAAEDLIAIHHGEDLQPRLRVTAGEVALSCRVSFGDWLRSALRPTDRDVTIVLHPAVEWSVAIRGGLADCALELSAGKVARVDVNGGCSDVRIDLPLPATVVPVRVAGGASHLLVQRPAGTGVALAAAGGLSGLRLDEQRFDAIGGSVRLESRNVVTGAPRYDLHIGGGASDLTIDRA